MQGWAEQIVSEMKAHPFTMIAVVALLAFAVYAQSGHARASEVSKLREQVDRVLVLQLGESIRSLSRQICELPEGSTKRDLVRTRDDLQEDYRELTGARYPVQSCQVRSD